MKNYGNISIIVVSALIASLLSELGTIKVVPIIFIFYYLYKEYKLHRNAYDFKGVDSKLFVSYAVFCVFLFVKSLFFDSNDGVLGNYYLSLIGNLEFGLLSLGVPICVYLIYENSFEGELIKACDLLAKIGIVVGLLYMLGVNISRYNGVLYLLPFLCVRLAIKHERSALYWAYFFFSLSYCYIEDERSILVMNVLSIAALYACLIIKKDFFVKLIKIYVIIIPIVGIGLTFYNLFSEESFFEMMYDKYSDRTTMFEDTRTFLFRELNEDLTKTDTWILGKGMFVTYYSDVMESAQRRGLKADSENRLGTECGFLWLILKGGIIYCLLYFSVFYMAILKAIRKRNYIYTIIAITLAHRLLLMFVSYTPRFDVANFFCWILIGTCFSKGIFISNNNNKL